MSDASVPAIVLNLASGALGLASSGTLWFWASQMGPRQRVIVVADAIPEDSQLAGAARKDAAEVRKEMPGLMLKEMRLVKVSAALMVLSIMANAAAQFF